MRARMLLGLVLLACGEWSGGDGAGGGGGAGQPPDEAPRCEAPQVEPCPEGETYFQRGWAENHAEGCEDARRFASVLVGRKDGKLTTYTVGATTTGCWPSGAAWMVQTCPTEDCQRCWDESGEPVACDDQAVAARYNAAWGL